VPIKFGLRLGLGIPATIRVVERNLVLDNLNWLFLLTVTRFTRLLLGSNDTTVVRHLLIVTFKIRSQVSYTRIAILGMVQC
jgi:hypothetical protein